MKIVSSLFGLPSLLSPVPEIFSEIEKGIMQVTCHFLIIRKSVRKCSMLPRPILKSAIRKKTPKGEKAGFKNLKEQTKFVQDR